MKRGGKQCSCKRKRLLRIYGAKIVESPAAEGSNGAVRVALELAEREPRYFMPFQYANEANPRAHYEGTGAEIVKRFAAEGFAGVFRIGTRPRRDVDDAKLDHVAFTWKDYRQNGAEKIMRLTLDEFIRRFLLHTLPARFHRILPAIPLS